MDKPDVHPLVDALASGLEVPAPPNTQIKAGSPEALARASDVPELVSFAGFLGDTIPQPGQAAKKWRVLYLDLELRNWLLVLDTDILDAQKVGDKTAPSGERDVIWVRADASVGRGRGSPSVEARFLTGEFTRAGDFEAPPTGGTLAAATGVFCEFRTPSCCKIGTRP
jgi:hypothetical protein